MTFLQTTEWNVPQIPLNWRLIQVSLSNCENEQTVPCFLLFKASRFQLTRETEGHVITLPMEQVFMIRDEKCGRNVVDLKICLFTSTQSGSTALGHLSWMAMPCEKSMTSSSVPWMTSTGDVTFDTLSMEGKASKHQVRCVLGKATLIPDISGECKITAPTSYLSN